MSPLYAILGLVAAQRLVELVYAAGNTRRLRALGAVEIDAACYPALVVLHAAWLGSMALLVPATTAPEWWLIAVFALLQVGRVWVIGSLGRRWTTRIIVLPHARLVRHGPYRYCRHPNYLVVIGEIAVLPLAFHAPGIAAAFSLANLVLLVRRIHLEEQAWHLAAL